LGAPGEVNQGGDFATVSKKKSRIENEQRQRRIEQAAGTIWALKHVAQLESDPVYAFIIPPSRTSLTHLSVDARLGKDCTSNRGYLSLPRELASSASSLCHLLFFGPCHKCSACFHPPTSLYFVTPLWLVATGRRHIALAWCGLPDSPSPLHSPSFHLTFTLPFTSHPSCALHHFLSGR